jgi:hypothetical protein
VSDFYYEVNRKARKQHRCTGCWWKSETNPIKPGQTYWAVRGVFEGDFFTSKLCETCREYLRSDTGKEFAIYGWYRGDLLTARNGHEWDCYGKKEAVEVGR